MFFDSSFFLFAAMKRVEIHRVRNIALHRALIYSRRFLMRSVAIHLNIFNISHGVQYLHCFVPLNSSSLRSKKFLSSGCTSWNVGQDYSWELHPVYTESADESSSSPLEQTVSILRCFKSCIPSSNGMNQRFWHLACTGFLCKSPCQMRYCRTLWKSVRDTVVCLGSSKGFSISKSATGLSSLDSSIIKFQNPKSSLSAWMSYIRGCSRVVSWCLLSNQFRNQLWVTK